MNNYPLVPIALAIVAFIAIKVAFAANGSMHFMGPTLIVALAAVALVARLVLRGAR